MTGYGCQEFRDDGPELALGLMAGDQRGAALSHLGACARCRRYLKGLVQVADDLLLLVASAEPEIGFESRVMARLSAEGAFSPPLDPDRARVGPTPDATGPALEDQQAGPRRHDTVPDHQAPGAPRRRGVRVVLVGVAAALVVVAGVSGLVLGSIRGRDRARHQQAVSATQLAARTVVIRADGGRSTCQLVAFPAHGNQPARLVINLDESGDSPGSYQILAEPVDGTPAVLVGTIAMVGGHGMLAASIPAGTGPVDAVRIIDLPNTVKYRATFLAA